MYEETARICHEALREYRPAREYLRGRGVADSDVEQWQLGFAPEGEAVTRGLWNRVTVPIHDAYGRVASVAGRLLPGHETVYLDTYWHIPFLKSGVLFGLWRAKRQIVDTGNALLVEGQFDCLSLHRIGLTNAVACLGSSLDAEGQQACLLARYARRVLVVADPGEKAREGAAKSVRQLRRFSVDAEAARPQLTLDPDEAARREPDVLHALVSRRDQRPGFLSAAHLLHHSREAAWRSQPLAA